VTARDLVRRSLGHYWRTNLAVIAGVATAVAVLSGALLVGDSVRGSLRPTRRSARRSRRPRP
jgi:putative ABC transport system permease protein